MPQLFRNAVNVNLSLELNKMIKTIKIKQRNEENVCQITKLSFYYLKMIKKNCNNNIGNIVVDQNKLKVPKLLFNYFLLQNNFQGY